MISNNFEESKKRSAASARSAGGSIPVPPPSQQVFIDDEKNLAVIMKKGSTFSFGRMATYCKSGKYAPRIGAGTPIYMAAVLEYLVFEILELAAAEAAKDKKKRITPDHIMRAVYNDPELTKLVQGQFCRAGFVQKVKTGN